MESQKSEVRRLLIQIDAEYEAAERGLHGLAHGSAQHEFLTARTERIAALYARLDETTRGGPQAQQLIVEHQSLTAKH